VCVTERECVVLYFVLCEKEGVCVWERGYVWCVVVLCGVCVLCGVRRRVRGVVFCAVCERDCVVLRVVWWCIVCCVLCAHSHSDTHTFKTRYHTTHKCVCVCERERVCGSVCVGTIPHTTHDAMVCGVACCVLCGSWYGVMCAHSRFLRIQNTRPHNTQHATRNTQHATRNTQHATRNTQHTTHNTQHTMVCGIVCCVLRVVYCVLCVVCCVLCVVCCVLCGG